MMSDVKPIMGCCRFLPRRWFRHGVIFACLLVLLCSCRTEPHRGVEFVNTELPAASRFNVGAGQGDVLYLHLHLEKGEELLFVLDVGSSGTILDKSLEPKLGPRQGTWVNWGWAGPRLVATYRAPKLL